MERELGGGVKGPRAPGMNQGGSGAQWDLGSRIQGQGPEPGRKELGPSS